jgi:hypothetical protein
MTETVRLTRHLLQLFQEPEWVVENGAAKAEWVENTRIKHEFLTYNDSLHGQL